MDTELEVAKGQDIEFEFQIKDSAGAAIPLNTGIDRLFIIMHYKDGTILAKFAKPTQTGWLDVTGSGVNYTAGICRARVTTNITGPAKEGKIYVETRVKIADGNSLDDSQVDYIERERYLCTIKNTVSSGITLP